MRPNQDATLDLSVQREQNQQVTVRQLPEGDAFSAMLEALDHQLLRLNLLPENTALNLGAGALVEVNCSRTLFLGEVTARDGGRVTVRIEHALDRAALESIQQVWYVPADD